MIGKSRGSLGSSIGNGVRKQLLGTFLVRIIVTLGGVLFYILLGRLYGAENLGIFTIAIGLMTGVAIVTRLGLDKALIKFMSISGTDRERWAYLRYAFMQCIVLSVLGALSLAALGGAIGYVYESDLLKKYIYILSLSIPPFSLCFLISGFFKGLRRSLTAAWFENGAVMIFACFFIMLGVIWYNNESPLVPVISFTLSSWIVFALGGGLVAKYFLKSRLGGNFSDVGKTANMAIDVDDFSHTSKQFFFSNFAIVFHGSIAVLIAAYFIIDAEVGMLKAAERISLIVSFTLVVINSVFPPRFARLYSEKKYDELRDMARASCFIATIVAIIPVMTIVIFSDEILGLFGEGFHGAKTALYVLTFAQFVNVAVGSVGFLLNMTGNEVLMRNISVFSCALSILAITFLSSLFGLLGATIGISIAIIVQNSLGLFFVRKKLGFWVFGYTMLGRSK